MISDTGEDTLKSTDLYCFMVWDDFVMFTALLSGYTYVAARLSGDSIAING